MPQNDDTTNEREREQASQTGEAADNAAALDDAAQAAQTPRKRTVLIGYFLPIGICAGMLLGNLIGARIDASGVGTLVGLAVGAIIGLLCDTAAKRRRENKNNPQK